MGCPVVVHYLDEARYVRITHEDRVIYEVAYSEKPFVLSCFAEYTVGRSELDVCLRDWLDSVYFDALPCWFIEILRDRATEKSDVDLRLRFADTRNTQQMTG
jgi:hypothetical protein